MAKNDPPSKKDFFISYNKADREWAEWIAQQLEQVGKYSVLIQAWDFRPGGNFVLDMQRALVSCNRMVAVLSPDYLTSVFTAPEWAAAFGEDSTGFKHKLIPVRVRECKPGGLLANIVYIDLLNLNAADAGNALLAGVDSKPVDRTTPRLFPGIAEGVAVRMKRPPGMVPDIWNVPHLRNPNFTEPGQLLTEMHDALRSGKPAALTQALAGLGGVGKTQLAIEYAYRHACDYAIVWWIRSEQPSTLAADYAALATALNLREKDAAKQPVIVAAVREALQRSGDWLLVFDNANDPEEIRDYLPAMGGHVLITSRNTAWGGITQVVPVKKWSPEVAAEFLLKRTGQADAAAAADLARGLDFLPIALEQAAAYIEFSGKTLAGYFALFSQKKLVLLQCGPPGTNYPAIVATTWEISFQGLEKKSPAGAALLHLCAFFAPDDIPRDAIAADAKHLPEPLRAAVSDALAFDVAVGAIRRYSLIETGGEATLSVHRLVQAVVRDRLGELGQKQWAEIAVNAVNRAFPQDSNELRTWKECDDLLPHAQATAAFAENLGVGLEAAALLANRIGVYLRGRAQYATARVTLESAIRLHERLGGARDPSIAALLNNLGTVLVDLGELTDARIAIERAIDIETSFFGPEHPHLAVTINTLGRLLQASGDWPGARTAFERALRIDETALAPDDPTIAIRLNNLGRILTDLCEFHNARETLVRAVQIAENAGGPDHPMVATTVSNLGIVLRKLGDIGAAKACFERALRIGEKAFGPVHPAVASYFNNLGSSLRALGDLRGAKAAFDRAFQIDEKIFGFDHPSMARNLNNLGGVQKDSGNLPGARAAYERALRIDEKALGPYHPNVALRYANLGSIMQDMGDLPSARVALKRALAIFQKALGDDHPDTRLVRESLEAISS